MFRTSFETRRRYEGLGDEALARHQLARFNQLLEAILPRNRFYAKKLAEISKNLGEAMVGINCSTLPQSEQLATRGW